MNTIKKIFIATLVLVGLCMVPAPVSANVDDFEFEDFTVDYYLSKSEDGRSRLRVVEKLVALFPDYEQNKGIVRGMPSRYDGHSVRMKLESVTRNGQPEPLYSEERGWDYFVLSTGTDDYLTGRQVYEISYSLQDVVKDFSTHQELYWDTNGTGWSQAFRNVTARLHLEGDLPSALDGQMSCYEGVSGSITKCSHKSEGDQIIFQSNGSLGPNENLTLAAGFKKDSFVMYQRNSLVLAMIVGLGVLVAAVLISGIVVFLRRGRSAKGRGIIAPEYLPPKDVSVMFASRVNGVSTHVLAAQFIDLAVRHKVQIIEQEKAGIFKSKKTYSVKLLNSSGLLEEEKRLLESTTGLSEGGQFEFKPGNSSADMAIYQLMSGMPKRLLEKGYTRKIQIPKSFKHLSLVVLLISVISFIITIVLEDVLTLVPIIAGAVTMVMLIVLYSLRPLTETGVALKEYLRGMKMYIKVGEEERLKVLQSPSGADKTPVKNLDKASIVKLYERMLPYAVLFGLEKEWSKVLELQYSDGAMSPSWYSGTSGFHTGMVSSMVSGFSTSVGSTMSSSSGAGGGGSSGGGGGGGGGGGR